MEERTIPHPLRDLLGLGSGPELAPARPSNRLPPAGLGPELGRPGCLIRGSAGHARQPLENLRSGTITPNWASRIQLKKTDCFSPGDFASEVYTNK